MASGIYSWRFSFQDRSLANGELSFMVLWMHGWIDREIPPRAFA